MECNLVWNHTRDFKIERARSASSIWNHKYNFRPKLHSTQFNYHFIKSILKSHNFMALNFRFWCIVQSRAVCQKLRNRKRFDISFSMQMMSCDEKSFKHNKQTLLKRERKQSLSCIKVRFSSPESMMEDLPFFCGWGWDFSLSLEKEFEGAAGSILQWPRISFELWNSLDCTMPSCGEFSPNVQ